MRYYEIARLIDGVSIKLSGNKIHVNLDKVTPQDHITNDNELKEFQAKKIFFYISGGGTIIINDRYMPIVRRMDSAKNNPGKYSLFTGRAEGRKEWENPNLVIRELFEELLLYKNGEKLVPRCAQFQEAINDVYKGISTSENYFELNYIPLKNSILNICCNGVENSMDGFLDISGNGDMNLLFALSANISLEGLEIIDGESLHSGGGRGIFLLDIETMHLNKMSGEIKPEVLGICGKEQMTQHLNALLEAVKKIYNIE